MCYYLCYCNYYQHNSYAVIFFLNYSILKKMSYTVQCNTRIGFIEVSIHTQIYTSTYNVRIIIIHYICFEVMHSSYVWYTIHTVTPRLSFVYPIYAQY